MIWPNSKRVEARKATILIDTCVFMSANYCFVVDTKLLSILVRVYKNAHRLVVEYVAQDTRALDYAQFVPRE